MNEIRLLALADIPAALELCRHAGWNQTEADWRRVLALEPEGAFGVADGGRVVATATAVCYGRRLAWIGMVLTHPECRGRGLARRLMTHTLDWLEARRIEWIKLDATDMGRPLYEQLGFRVECPVERRLRPAGPAASTSAKPPVADPELDLRGFGADRSVLLRTLATEEARHGRPGFLAAYFGPCVAPGAGEARACLEWFLGRHPREDVFWDLLPDNQPAVELAREYGFALRRKLARMALMRPGSAPFVEDRSLVFAIAGFEYG